LVETRALKPEPLAYEEYKRRFSSELAELRERVIASGKEDGLQRGRLAAESEFKSQLQALRALIDSVRESRARYIEAIADDAAEIVFAAIGKILGDAFADRSAVLAAVRETIRRNTDRTKLLVRVAPEQLELLNASRRELLEGISADHLDLVADDQVKLGGCVLESACGSLDGRLEIQLQRVREALQQARAAWGKPA
jgi:flagellar assembly protein FliH